ncbi:MAG: hypothetical protein HC905_07780, partial [Bacteroidales bacterium]|nr:hypothetical protein [Bacteroidales bacterium]
MIIFTGIFSVSCENDLEVVQALSDPEKVPDATVVNSEILYYDSSLLKAKVNSKLVLSFSNTKESYYEFPEGIHVQIYDSLKNVTAEVKSKYAIYKEKTDIWEA